jgi:hypothetical protein
MLRGRSEPWLRNSSSGILEFARAYREQAAVVNNHTD